MITFCDKEEYLKGQITKFEDKKFEYSKKFTIVDYKEIKKDTKVLYILKIYEGKNFIINNYAYVSKENANNLLGCDCNICNNKKIEVLKIPFIFNEEKILEDIANLNLIYG